MRLFFALYHFADRAEHDIDHKTKPRSNCIGHTGTPTRYGFRVSLFIRPLGTAADHAIPHLLENRQRCKHRKREQQNALYRLHINGSG